MPYEDPKAEDIGSGVEFPGEDFWSHVAGVAGEVVLEGGGGGVGGFEFGKAEVTDFDFPFSVDEDVVGTKVSVEDTCRGGVN